MKLTLLEIIGNAVQLLLLIVLPVVLAIKNWDTTLKAIKMLLKFEASEAMDDSKESTDAIRNTAKKRKL
jgi:hypothetical protein